MKHFVIAAAILLAAASVGAEESVRSVLTIEEAMEAALANDATLADARSRLKIAGNALARSSSVYGSSLGFSGSVSGNAGSSDSAPSSAPSGASAASDGSTVRSNLGANVSIPLAKWITVGAEASSDLETFSGSLTVSLNPFAKADSSAETAWKKALIEAQGAVRTTILSVRREYRALNSARSEYEYRKAAVRTAENELSRIGYLVELGKERKSKEISAYGSLMEAQGNLDAALNSVNSALQALSARTGLSEAVLQTLAAGDADGGADSPARTLVDEEAWVLASAELALSEIGLAQQRDALKSSASLPGLSLGASASDDASWSATVKVTLSPDVLFQKNIDSAAENLAIQKRSMEKTERSVRTAWKNQQNALAAAERNYANALRFLESAKLSYEETELLFSRGESAQASLDEANEKLLSAQWQLERSAESLENARDQLDAAWQVSISRQE